MKTLFLIVLSSMLISCSTTNQLSSCTDTSLEPSDLNTATENKNCIREKLEEKIPEINGCYTNSVKSEKAPLQATIVLDFIIAPNGKVNKFGYQSKEEISDNLIQCIKNIVLDMEFPKPTRGGSIGVRQPIYLKFKR